MRRLVKDLWLSSSVLERRGVVRSLLYTLLVALVALVFYRDLYLESRPPAPTNHEVLSFNMALNSRFCGKTGHLSSKYSPYLFLTTHSDHMSLPFERTVAAEAGSIAEYCRTVTAPYVVSENALMWLGRLALWANRRLTPDGLGGFLASCRICLLLVFGFALVRFGGSVLFALATVLVGCAILRHVGVRDTPYPFLVALPLALAGLYGLVLANRATSGSAFGRCIFAFIMGLLTAFSATMRTVLLPISAAMFAVSLLSQYKQRAKGPSWLAMKTAVWLGVPVLLFGLGYAAYVRVFVEPLRFDQQGVSDYAYHTFAHPLVLGLAIPESDFARRQGIAWDDMAGLALARKIEPGVEMLGPEYESALLRYYGRLWRAHPREMTVLYGRKLRWTGSGVFSSAASVAQQFGIPVAPVEWMHQATNGWMLLALVLVVFALSVRRYLAADNDRMLVTALVSVSAFFAFAEAFVMHSIFLPTYSSELLFFLFFALFTAIQAVVDTVAQTATGPSHRGHH